MDQRKEVVLQIERFHDDEDREFRIPSKKEILSILQRLVEQGTRAALYYDEHNNFILTTLLGANENGMWLDVGPFPPENERLLLSEHITFVSMHQNVKVQFVAHHVENVPFENTKAFYLELPEYLLRIQRRDYFRQSIPANAPIKCSIPAVRREVSVLDISVGGIGLLCGDNEAQLVPGKTFEDCQIPLAGIGTVKVTIEVKSNIRFTARNGAVQIRAGCQFIDPSIPMQQLLNRYVTRLQAEAAAKAQD